MECTGGNLVLIPEYGAGFSLLDGHQGVNVLDSSIGSTVQNTALDLVTTAISPALEGQAAAEAKRKFVGIYKSNIQSWSPPSKSRSTTPTRLQYHRTESRLRELRAAAVLPCCWTTIAHAANCSNRLNAGRSPYGNFDVGLFVFDIDSNGKASFVRPAATLKTLERKAEGTVGAAILRGIS